MPGEPANQFHRDLRVLLRIGAGTAALIAAVGALALRGVRWEEGAGLLRELGLYAAGGVVVLAGVGVWVGWVVRRLRRKPPAQG